MEEIPRYTAEYINKANANLRPKYEDFYIIFMGMCTVNTLKIALFDF
jgi:hypothetical protein